MELSPASLRALQRTLSTIFSRGYQESDIWYPNVATTVPSATSGNTYYWTDAVKGMTEFVGPREVQNIKRNAYALDNKDWQDTLQIPYQAIRDDSLGSFTSETLSLGDAVAKHPDELMVSLLQNGHTGTIWDGKAYFATDHPVSLYDASLGTYQNYTASGLALTDANFMTVRTRMMAYKNAAGRPAGAVPTLVVAPPSLEGKCIELFKNELNAAGGSNTTKGMANYLIVPELENQPTTWYSIVTTRPIKPFVYQVRERPRFMSKTSLTEESVMSNLQCTFMAYCCDNAGYTLPILAYKAAA